MTGPFGYDVHGLVTIRSTRRLPELERFRSSALGDRVDIDVSVSSTPGRSGPGTISYAERFGRFGFSVTIEREATTTRVIASPLVGASPHVLYTNVIEPILRWALVRHDHALLHGACLADDGRALFITARTDTGKTTTVLHAMRADPAKWSFLADDMTIVNARGTMLSFPKPLTISLHTLEAVGGAPLATWERLALQVQSRLHSRGGRRTGLWLSDRGLPAATLNAIVQLLIPPPKYMIDRLLPGVGYGVRATLAGIVVIERGPDLQEELDEAETTDVLLSNADDAYGFPPYASLAPHLRVFEGEDLRERERAIVAAVARGVTAVRVRRSDRAWHLNLPALAASAAHRAAAADRAAAAAERA